MSPRMTRRALLQSGGPVLAGIGTGCLSTEDSRPNSSPSTESPTTGSPTPRETPTATGTYASQPSGPKSYPSRPEDQRKSAAVAFAKAFEQVRVHNALSESNVEDMSARGNAIHYASRPSGHYVLATGSGYANYADGLHADWGQLPALFFVSPSLVVRTAEFEEFYFDCQDVFASDTPDENFVAACEGASARYRAYNVNPEPHELSVTVEFLGEDGPTTVLEREYQLSYDHGIQQGSVTRRRGTYRLSAALESGPTATDDWELSTPPTAPPRPVTVLVTPAGGLTIRRVPFGEI